MTELQETAPAKPRRGAPIGNLNAVKSGTRCRDRFNLVVGMGAKRDRKIIDRLRGFRNRLETITAETHGEVNIMHAAYINSAVRWEKVAALGDRWLREEGEKLDANERLNLVTTIARASDSRDKCLEKLRLDVNPADAWTVLHNAPAARTRDEAPATTENTAETTTTQEASE